MFDFGMLISVSPGTGNITTLGTGELFHLLVNVFLVPFQHAQFCRDIRTFVTGIFFPQLRVVHMNLVCSQVGRIRCYKFTLNTENFKPLMGRLLRCS